MLQRNKYLTPDKLNSKDRIEPTIAVNNLFASLNDIQNNYAKNLNHVNDFFTKTDSVVSGLDVIASRYILTSTKGDTTLNKLLVVLQGDDVVSVIDEDGDVAYLLSRLFSFYPEYWSSLRYDLKAKLKFDISWVNESVQKIYNTHFAEFIEEKNIKYREPHRILIDLDFDAAMKLKEHNQSDYSDDASEESPVYWVIEKLRFGTPSDIKMITDKCLSVLQSAPLLLKDEKKKVYVDNYMSLIYEALKRRLLPNDVVSIIVDTVLKQLYQGFACQYCVFILMQSIEASSTQAVENIVKGFLDDNILEKIFKDYTDYDTSLITDYINIRIRASATAMPYVNRSRIPQLTQVLLSSIDDNGSFLSNCAGGFEKPTEAMIWQGLATSALFRSSDENDAQWCDENRRAILSRFIKRLQSLPDKNIEEAEEVHDTIISQTNKIFISLPAEEQCVFFRKLLPIYESNPEFFKNLFKPDYLALKLQETLPALPLAIQATIGRYVGSLSC